MTKEGWKPGARVCGCNTSPRFPEARVFRRLPRDYWPKWIERPIDAKIGKGARLPNASKRTGGFYGLCPSDPFQLVEVYR
jgi:hypothetical protein